MAKVGGSILHQYDFWLGRHLDTHSGIIMETSRQMHHKQFQAQSNLEEKECRVNYPRNEEKRGSTGRTENQVALAEEQLARRCQSFLGSGRRYAFVV